MKTTAIAALATLLLLGGPSVWAQVCNPLDPLPGTVLRDAAGVPHVFAANQADLTFINGYVEAQDRLFEMEILRRAGQGRLSEVLGAAQLDMDVTVRRDLYTPAERQAHFDALPAADRQLLTSFAAGVNRYICEARLDRATKMPAEYTLLGFEPEDWSVLDSVAAAEYLTGVFGVFGGDEVRNAAFFFDVESRVGRGRAKKIFTDHFPLFHPESPTTIPQTELQFDDPLRHSTRAFRGRQLRILEQYKQSIYRAAGVASAEAQAMAERREALGIPAGGGLHASNAILVHGSKTDTGNPILLGGPQVGYAIPSFFYEVGLHLPSSGAVGVLPPAGPSIVIGRTENFAYTVTSGISDQVDTYLEVLNPANPQQYLYNGSYQDMDCRQETFTVKEPPPPVGSGGAATTEQREFCRTVHGPVFFLDALGGAAFSRRYSTRDRELASSATWLRMALTTTLAEFEALVDQIDLSFNYFFADNQGNIKYLHAGRRPLRPSRSDPRFPLPGTGEWEWTGFLPKAQMPRIQNPRQGWLANWNNNPIRGWSSGDIRENWGLEHRVQALQDALARELAADGSLSVDDVNLAMFEAAKRDTYAAGRAAFDGKPSVFGPWVELLAAVGRVPVDVPDRASLVAGIDLIQQWINAATAVTMTGVRSGAPVPRTVHFAPLLDTDGDGFGQYPGAALYERWRSILQLRVFGDELGEFVEPLRYVPAPGANTGDHGGGDTQDSVLAHAIRGRGPTGRRTVRYFDDITTPERESSDFQMVESLRQAMAQLGDCLAPSPMTCRHANDVNVFTSLGGAPNQTIGRALGGVDRGSYNQIVECAPTLFSVNIQPPGQSGHITPLLLAEIQAAPDEATQRQFMDAAHLTDQLERYERFQYKPMPFTMAEVLAAQ